MLPQFESPEEGPAYPAAYRTSIVDCDAAGESIEISLRLALTRARETGAKKILLKTGSHAGRFNYAAIISIVESFPIDFSLALLVERLENSILNPYKFLETSGQNRWKRIKVFDNAESARRWLG